MCASTNNVSAEQPPKLLPVVFVKGDYSYHRQNLFQQNLLLKALRVTQDPKELKNMIGVKTVAEVYRTLDKMAIRKEYHEALLRQGLDLDNIIKGIKQEAEQSESSSVRLSAYRTLLRSLGLDTYQESAEVGGKNWEDVLLETTQAEAALPEGERRMVKAKYEVIEPKVPDAEKQRQDEDRKLGQSLYE